MTEKKDIVWLDWARFMGISLVIIGHLLQHIRGFDNSYLKIIWEWIYLFHMPLFFVISGYLFKKANTNYFIKIYHNLFVPYLLYQLFFFPLAAIRVFKAEGIIGLFKLLTGVFMGDGYDTLISYYDCLPCWFIICIIQIRILFKYVPINFISTFILVCFSIIFLLWRKENQLDLYFCLDSTIMAVPYFLLGFWLSNSKLQYVFSIVTKYRYRALLFAMGAFMVITSLYIYDGPSQMNGPFIPSNIMLSYLAGIFGTLLIFSLSSLIKAIPFFIRQISRNTLFLIFYHWIFLYFTYLLYNKYTKEYSNVITDSIYVIISLSIILISANYIISKLQPKYPFFLGKLKNN